MSDPFIIAGPCLWSFSGGRTSGYMLRRALQAYGGRLPADHAVAFANTGKERPETLRFVHECGSRWGVDIVWVEWRPTAEQALRILRLADRGKATRRIADWAMAKANPHGFEQVGFNSASRDGEPFEALIALKQRLPHWRERWCTTFLKIAPMHAYLLAVYGLGLGSFAEPVGLRADEVRRVVDMVAGDAESGRRRTAPLARAGVGKAEVTAFWEAQDFDLNLRPGEGNCDLCFATGRRVRIARLAKRPDCGRWWARMELSVGAQFDRRDSVNALAVEAQSGCDDAALDDEINSECGDGGCDVVRATLRAITQAAAA